MHFKRNFRKVEIWLDFIPPPKVEKFQLLGFYFFSVYHYIWQILKLTYRFIFRNWLKISPLSVISGL